MPIRPIDVASKGEKSSSESRSVFVVDPSCCSLPYDYSLCKALSQKGWDVVLERSHFYLDDYFHGAQTFTEREQFYRITHRFHELRGTVWKYMKAAEHIWGTYAFLRRSREHRPSIIHYQWLMAPAVDAFFLEKLARIAPIVLTLHNTSLFHGRPSSRFQGLGFRSVFKHVDAIIVHAEYSKRRVVEAGWIDEDRVHIIPHGVLDHHGDAPVSRQANDQEQKILFFGKIVPYKGLDILLQAFAALPTKTRDRTHLVIAGPAGIDLAPLREMAQRLGISDRINWHIRFVDEREIPALFRSASIVALPYRDIDQSGVLLTALAFDKPVVATRVGGIPEIVRDGTHGLLTECGDVLGFSRALDSILTDPQRRRSMELAIRALRGGDLAWRNIASQTISLYEHLIARRLTGVTRTLDTSSHSFEQPVGTRAAS